MELVLLTLIPLTNSRAKLRMLPESLPTEVRDMVHLAELYVLIIIVLLVALHFIRPLVLPIIPFVLLVLVEVRQNS